MDRFICVHGHFYQPPRENPWLELVETQDEAYPFHDWNERITAECYGPNTRARILDDRGRIVRLVNNYARMSFNLGPTLLAWLEQEAPEVYDGVLEADERSAQRFGGHGSAMAQVYNHVIMPLANARDQRTQVRWGIRDFEHRFGRAPKGMWLAETAVDDDALELLAEHGIEFTVLSPYQAARTRPIGEREWTDARHGAVDPTRPYRVVLPSGRSIVVFFYDGPISRAVAFEGLLESGERFATRLLDGFVERDGPQLVNIATDGESYGHHHRHGEMALAAALRSLEHRDDVTVTNYGQYLERFPPTHEAEVGQATSWSCAHGVRRWHDDCGCSTGGNVGWHQAWRGPLRDALDWLRDELASRFEQAGGELLEDPWAARDAYIDVVLDRSAADAFLRSHARRPLGADDTVRVLRLLETQRQAMLMYTSCGWFFDELSRVEPLQVLRYAARAIQLAGQVHDVDLEEGFLQRLEKAPSNRPELQDGRRIYERLVRPDVTGLEQVGAHFAISGLFDGGGEEEAIGAFTVVRHAYQLREAGRAKLAYGQVTIRSSITRSERALEFGVLHFGDHNFACGIRPSGRPAAYERMAAELEEHFAKADFPEVIRAVDDHFGGHGYSLRSLFRDEQRRLLQAILETTVSEAEATYRNIYRGRAPLMRFLGDLGAQVPVPLRSAAEVVINAELRDTFRTGHMEPAHVRELVAEAERFDVELDAEGLAHALTGTVRRLSRRIREVLDDELLFEAFGREHATFFSRISAVIEVASDVPFEVDMTDAQDVLWTALRDHYAELSGRALDGDADADRWVQELTRLAARLNVVPPDAE